MLPGIVVHGGGIEAAAIIGNGDDNRIALFFHGHVDALRLRVVRNDSNYTEYTSKFTIAN